MSNTTHNYQILLTLKAGASITPMDALRQFNCFRLGARIHDLKHGNYDGHKYDIETVMERRDGKRYARYRLANFTDTVRIINALQPFKEAPKVENTAPNSLF